MNNTNQEVGYVISTRHFLVHLDGLPSARLNDLVENEQGVRGLVNALLPSKVEVLILDESHVTPGQLFKHSHKRLTITAGDFLLGRAINPLGVPIDGKGLVGKADVKNQFELDTVAEGIRARRFITDQFITGLSTIDTLVPLGKGQRELVVGDAHSGKTSFIIDLIVNQAKTGTICIYAMIGKPAINVRNVIDILRTNNALSHTVIIAATSTDTPTLILLSPLAAFTLAEYFQRQGRDVLLILDDLGIHAKIYREISLIGGKIPGREAYPGDIFYAHSKMIERAGSFRKEFGGGSITAIPVIEINMNDFTTFIPTNVMSMTDGHLLFKSSLYNQGQRPAVDLGLSVSRVGRQTQNRLHNLLARRIRQVLSQAAELETVSRFSSELPYETRLVLHQKEVIEELLKQDSLTFIPREVQVILLALTFVSIFKEQDINFVKKNKNLIINTFQSDPKLVQITRQCLQLQTDDELIAILETTVPRLKQICATK